MKITDEPLEKFVPHCSVCGRQIYLSENAYEQNGELLCKECFDRSYTIRDVLEIALANRDSAYEQSMDWDD